jgi:hypothetical protein
MRSDVARMIYRRVEYNVEGIGRGVWKWSATVDSVSVTGLATSETQAVAGAENAIDQALALKK